MIKSAPRCRLILLVLILFSGILVGGPLFELRDYIRDHYEKREIRIPMRDGVHLFTAVYLPRDRSRTYPILLKRTPYGVGPYGPEGFPETLGPSEAATRAGYIFAYQDVRGRYLSEGVFENMRPHRSTRPGVETDESTDTWDTIDWLVKNLPGHNGKVGMWGVSYPGFYAAVGMIDAHPALKAVSPQAPIADWYFDDFFHHGAFFLAHAFNFFSSFGLPRPGPTTEGNPRFDHGTPDGYAFFLRMGPLANADRQYLQGRVDFWKAFTEHPTYDSFWQDRNVLPRLRQVAPAVMVVGGWYDAEDLYGPLHIYRRIEEQNPGVFNVLVMGPWSHGAWENTTGEALGNIRFGSKTAVYYREEIELRFFESALKGSGTPDLPEATVFETGRNQWRTFDQWPPKGTRNLDLHLRERGALSFSAPADPGWVWDEYISDPARPVPFSETISPGMSPAYMCDDQRFASRRPDVLAYQTEPLQEALTLAGPLEAELWVATSGTDADWVVKLIDVFPDDAGTEIPAGGTRPLGGYQMLVRSEVLRGRYRESYSRPVPFEPDQPVRVRIPLQDVLHTFLPGHRIMIQVQSSWFPLVDRNPQTFVANIFLAEETDFRPARQRVFRSQQFPSRVRVGVLEKGR